MLRSMETLNFFAAGCVLCQNRRRRRKKRFLTPKGRRAVINRCGALHNTHRRIKARRVTNAKLTQAFVCGAFSLYSPADGLI